MKDVNEYHQKYNQMSNNVDTSSSLHEEFFKFIQNFYKMEVKEIGPTTQNINEIIFEQDLGIIIDELVNLILTNLNKGKEEKKAANLKNSLGMYSLGKCYEVGIGTDVNKQKAFELYHKVADLGNSHGIYCLGCCYDDGVGIDVNKEKAFKLYQMAADLGHIFGINNLGCCYDNGHGTEVNKKKAFELFQKAAILGNDFAQYNLALMYADGKGVEKNIDLAIYWFKKSAEQGDQDALSKLNKLKKIE
ncbi:kinase-like domain-containing protein [Rhizophagus irregularis DAOM 181602=DAOM 197198]|nr:kinase-like domain-containing protein [Rhizophagus irregularis DAOM 181602=DAOM 197198]